MPKIEVSQPQFGAKLIIPLLGKATLGVQHTASVQGNLRDGKRGDKMRVLDKDTARKENKGRKDKRHSAFMIISTY